MNETLHTLSGAYALDALDLPERKDFERHLRRCQECADEVAGFLEATAELASAAAHPPPAELRQRVLREIRQVRQSPPLVPGVAATRSWWRRLSGPALLAAACVLVAAVLGALLVRTGAELADSDRRAGDMAAVLAAPDARLTSARVGDADARLVYSPSRGQIVLTSANMPALPRSRDYQVWLMGPGGVRPAGLMGRDSYVVAGAVNPADRIGLTVEPAGGSRQPTSPVLAVLPLPT
ncbi:anti-sigma factor domain-containing protein [Nonomuraea sp. NPDC050790]|uniref:anti-sigma factor n=1 Tax=Nonomuraea sp. NPDC050790 TaxID=3364371 RepID=UPI0037B21E78